jgi:hypothetical protein
MKKTIIGVLIAFAVLLFALKGLEYWVETNFAAKFNSNPDRSYNITYSELNLNTFLNGITLENVSIEPLDHQEGTFINGHVNDATLDGLALKDLLFGKSLNIEKIAFDQPMFEVTLSQDSIRHKDGKGFQAMFGDIISSMNIKNFSIDNGSIVLRESNSEVIKGEIKKINIDATEINTDSLKLEHIIPFEMDDLQVDMNDISFQLNEYTTAALGHLKFRLKDEVIILSEVSLGYSIDWVEVSKRVGFQTDIIELNAKELAIHKFESSNNFYLQLDVVAKKMSIDSLDIKLQRNKNIPRPPDTLKPSFQGIINEIPIALLLDSIQITNSSITYGELGLKKHETGSIKIQDVHGSISGITNMPDHQNRFGQFEAKIEASLFGKGDINVELNAPYKSDDFTLEVAVGAMNMTSLNPTLKPLVGVELVSGQMRRIQFNMNAGAKRSKNKLVFNYNNLQLNVLNQKNKAKGKKNRIFSAIANGAIRTNNLPGEKRYRYVQYRSKRNLYRSPINYIIQGLVQGFERIVPGRIARQFIN